MSDLIEVKTSNLAGAALDWAVALATGADEIQIGEHGIVCIYDTPEGGCWTNMYQPASDWSQGGPLIEKHMVSLHCPQSTGDVWAGWVITEKGEFCQAGDHALIAACRAIVAAKLGDTVQVPKDLMP